MHSTCNWNQAKSYPVVFYGGVGVIGNATVLQVVVRGSIPLPSTKFFALLVQWQYSGFVIRWWQFDSVKGHQIFFSLWRNLVASMLWEHVVGVQIPLGRPHILRVFRWSVSLISSTQKDRVLRPQPSFRFSSAIQKFSLLMKKRWTCYGDMT